MIMDPGNDYIKAINRYTPLKDAVVLEIGCGSGRMTVDLARYAARVVATDTNLDLINQARQSIKKENVEFLHSESGLIEIETASFDLVIYTLSLHHVEPHEMRNSLIHSGNLLKKDGKIVIIEPGRSGSFIDIKKRFGAGSGDESHLTALAEEAMRAVDGWSLSPRFSFTVDFLFDDEDDFISTKMASSCNLSAAEWLELRSALAQFRTADGIILSSERFLNTLERY